MLLKSSFQLVEGTHHIIRVVSFRRLRWDGHIARMEEGRNAFNILIGTPIGKRSLGRPPRKSEENISTDIKEIVLNTRNWVDSVQDTDYWRTFVNVALNLRVP